MMVKVIQPISKNDVRIAGYESDEEYDADDYMFRRRMCISEEEKVYTMRVDVSNYDGGLGPIYTIFDLIVGNQNASMEWKGIRRGTDYTICVYIIAIGDELYEEIIDQIKKSLGKDDYEWLMLTEKTIRYKSESISTGFDIDDILKDKFVSFEEDRKFYHTKHADEGDLWIIEKHTKGCDWVSWDRDVPAEGDWISSTIMIVTFVLNVIKYLVERKEARKIREEKKLLNKYGGFICDNYDLQGYLVPRESDARDSNGNRMYVYEDRLGNRIYSVYGVNKKTGEVRVLL